ncbi:hypothetical protein MFLO_07157 [Listeria floridensis FSL S10-1187]|uniref:Uncharacterized protein n=1 Tax=Listeria floridensis FSL S10-1187 TaxID=1265817 RepID=A0ABP3AYL5_9LIST|nr:abortive infection system antitoxin AbiGi family protein [Listeria floridensis]EUJ32302.1 hypothetical protein MFLO_07157 [Listeria floridensis FSL S10-1187]
MENSKMLHVGVQNSEYQYKQSANTLFRFMPELKFLIEAIEKMQLFPRYVEESVEYLGIRYGGEPIRKILLPMLCFCDINLHRLPAHVEGNGRDDSGYGKYGIGLEKEWCEEKGLQPITYLNENSESKRLLQTALNRSFELEYNGNLDPSIEEYLDCIITQLALSKPLKGTMKKGETEIFKNFHDEKEWRYLPNLSDTTMPSFKNDVLDPELQNSIMNNDLSDSLKTTPGAPLTLTMEAVKYIFVHTIEDRNKMLEVLKNKFDIDEALLLASKIIVYNQIVKDW